jgi:hypothetical protein
MKPVAYAFAVILAVVLMYGTWIGIRFAVSHATCRTEQVKVQEISGIRFELEYENCDTFAKDEGISVYAEKKGSRSERPWFLPDRGDQRTLLFRYDPGRPDNPLPSITRLSESAVVISIPEVSSILYQNRRWGNMSINYEIGRVDYPAPVK